MTHLVPVFWSTLVVFLPIFCVMAARTLPGTVLYTHRMCPFAQKVCIALQLAGSPFELKEIDLYGNKPSWFLDMNPQGLVPVLNHNGRIITESEVIIDYIASSSYPKSPKAGCLFETKPGATLDDTVKEQQRVRLLIDRQLKPLGKKAVLSGSFDSNLQTVLSELDHLVARKDFMVGDRVTMADATAFPFLYRLHNRYAHAWEFESRFPALCAWLQRMAQIEEVGSTVETNWWWW